MFDLFRMGALVAEVRELIAHPKRMRAVVVAHPKLAQALAKHGVDVTQKESAEDPPPTIDDAAGTAVVFAGGAPSAAAQERWARAVGVGGLMVTLDKEGAAAATQRAIRLGLVGLEQRRVGRQVLTSGRISHITVATAPADGDQ